MLPTTGWLVLDSLKTTTMLVVRCIWTGRSQTTRRRAGSGKDHLSVHGLGVTAVGHDALTAANYRTSRSSSSPLVLSPCFLDRNIVRCVWPTYFSVADSVKTGLILVSLFWTLLGPRSQNVIHVQLIAIIISANSKCSPLVNY